MHGVRVAALERPPRPSPIAAIESRGDGSASSWRAASSGSCARTAVSCATPVTTRTRRRSAASAGPTVACSSERPRAGEVVQELRATPARDSGHSRVPAPPAGITAQKCSTSRSAADDAQHGRNASPPAPEPVTCRSPDTAARPSPLRHRGVRSAGPVRDRHRHRVVPALPQRGDDQRLPGGRVPARPRPRGRRRRPAPGTASYAGYAVHGLASVPVRQFPVGLPMPAQVEAVLADFARTSCTSRRRSSSARSALAAAARLGLPTVAVYQTDMPSYLRQHGRGVGRARRRTGPPGAGSAGSTSWPT